MSANVGVSMICSLRGVIEREGAGIGVFLTVAETGKPMVTGARGRANTPCRGSRK